MLGAMFTRFFDRMAARAALRFRGRIDRYKLARRRFVRAELLQEPAIAEAVRRHAATTGMTEEDTWRRVREYIREIVPFFNIIAYYQVGYRLGDALLRLFYKVSVEYQDRDALERLPRDSVLVYLMNHRSNADYVLVSYALAGHVAISYAVGEWARAFPLEYIFKAFGAYFVRRRYREALYHTVLESYVQLITRRGVTQGIFLEGGLTRDGKLRAPKLGLLDYVLGIGRDPRFPSRMYVVPVAVNYDRVLEDRTLLAELSAQGGRGRTSRLTQTYEVSRYVAWNLARIVVGRWKRYGRAAVTIGRPVPLAPWFAREVGLFELPRSQRLARVEALCDEIMDTIGALIPVTPVPLACAAIQSLELDFIPRARLLARMADMREVLVELNGRVLRADRSIDETLAVALRMLRMRRMVVADGGGFALIPGNRVLVSYYANSIAHLLGPFEGAVRDRDALPAETVWRSMA
jgi:glycerol-3-phosphate O-acyltransferase